MTDGDISHLPLVSDAQIHEVRVADRVNSRHQDVLHLLGEWNHRRPDHVVPELPGAAGLQLMAEQTHTVSHIIIWNELYSLHREGCIHVIFKSHTNVCTQNSSTYKQWMFVVGISVK